MQGVGEDRLCIPDNIEEIIRYMVRYRYVVGHSSFKSISEYESNDAFDNSAIVLQCKRVYQWSDA